MRIKDRGHPGQKVSEIPISKASCVVVYIYNPSHLGGGGRRILS
jgi:hypothetical protein